MGLFNIPTRKEPTMTDIIKKIKSEQELKPKIKLKSGSLLGKLEAIKQTVEKNLGDVANDYLLIRTDEDFINYCKEASTKEYVALDTETTGLSFNDQKNLVGVCIQADSMKPAYAPVGHISSITGLPLSNQVSKNAIKEGLSLIQNNKLIFHNGYYDLVVLYLSTGIWFKVYADTQLIAFSMNENESHSLKYLYDKYIMNGSAGVHKFAELFDGITAGYISPDVFYYYSAHDAEMTLKLFKFYLPYITKETQECKECDAEGISNILFNIEFPLVEILAKMRVRGVNIDYKIADELYKKYLALKDEALEKFNKAVSVYKDDIMSYNKVHTEKPLDYPLNYNSPDQIRTLFYDIIKTGVIFQKEPTGTGKHVIDEILVNDKYKNKPIFDIANTLSEVKKYDKLINTFIVKLPQEAKDYNGKIHCTFNSCGARTSRMSSSNPNLQQVPARNKDIRNMFVAGKDRVFIGTDFSQQEMMAMASLADDTKMLDAFHKGRDIYSHVASIAFNMPYEDCLEFYADGTTNKEGKKRRKSAKAITLGLAYGKGDKAISEDLHVTLDKAKEIREAVLGAFPDLANYLHNVVEYGKKTGYVKDYYGRKRRLPMLLKQDYEFKFPSKFDNTTQEYYKNVFTRRLSEVWKQKDIQKIIDDAKAYGISIIDNRSKIAKESREALNAPIQSTAAELTKINVLNIYKNKWLQEHDVHIELLVHDEVICSCPKKYAYKASQLLEKCAIDAGVGLKAQLRCDVAISESWEGEPLTFDEKHNLIKL